MKRRAIITKRFRDSLNRILKDEGRQDDIGRIRYLGHQEYAHYYWDGQIQRKDVYWFPLDKKRQFNHLCLMASYQRYHDTNIWFDVTQD